MNLVATLAVLVVGAVPPFGAIATLLWARWSGTPWSALGLARPSTWVWTIIGGAALGVVLKLLLKAVALPLLGAPATNTAYQQLVGNTPLLVQLAITTTLLGGIAEEIFWRGFLFERLGTVLGSAVTARGAIVVITAVAFGFAHYSEQGIPGVEQAIMTGLTFGALYAVTGVLWPSMVAHAVYDLIAIWLIYSGLETSVAHWFFR